jgi:hypothetical protein
MAQQLSFDFHRVTHDVYEMTDESISRAAVITILLLQEQLEQGITPITVTFHDIVQRRLGIVGDTIPEALAELYAENLKAVRDERHAIMETIEADGNFVLAVVDSIGRPAIRGGGKPAAAFVLRGSEAGARDSQAQIRMAIGKLRHVVDRERHIGRLSPERHDKLVADTLAFETALKE